MLIRPAPVTQADDWREQVFAAFEQAGVELFCYLPDAGLDSFISAPTPATRIALSC